MRLEISAIILLLFGSSACSQTQVNEPKVGQDTVAQIGHTECAEKVEAAEVAPKEDIPAGARKLIAFYPNQIKGYADNRLIMMDGSTIVYDDGKQKTHVQQMDNTDVEDMFAQPYDTTIWNPARDYDPGRARCEQLYKYMYGKTKTEVMSHLVKVSWFGQKLPFTSINGAADSLRAVEKELKSTLPASYQKYFAQSSTFNWRTVRGSNRLSAHSYGITIDICTKYSDFWRWTNPGKGETDVIKYVNRIPKEVIRIFEKHGFISGARWYHYDTMHFEFRPEIL